MPFNDVADSNDVDSVPHKMFQIGGGGGSLEEQCGSITFENMFEYSKATFDIIISDDLVRAETYLEDPLRMVTHLIMSTPEYQID